MSSDICFLGDIQPVQNPGKSWKKRLVYEDHTFNQSRTNAVYPMTHLLMDLKRYTDTNENGNVTRTVIRTGRPISFVYMAFFEQESTFNAMNEVFHLMNLPEADCELRSSTGALRPNLGFIVDNGHGEDPSSILTQMCMARFLSFLPLQKVTQRSFAEYHSKRNFVERVHSAENAVLSGHGPFSSDQLHKNAEIGSSLHRENMKCMANDVIDCLKSAKFNGHNLITKRGDTVNCYFDDEDKLKRFLSLTEDQKKECEWTYKPCNNVLVNDLQVLWGSTCQERTYYSDYQLINNLESSITAWKDRYGSTIVKPSYENFFESQPLPDYLRWYETRGEQHYCSTERTLELVHDIKILQTTPAIFLPSRILMVCFNQILTKSLIFH